MVVAVPKVWSSLAPRNIVEARLVTSLIYMKEESKKLISELGTSAIASNPLKISSMFLPDLKRNPERTSTSEFFAEVRTLMTTSVMSN